MALQPNPDTPDARKNHLLAALPPAGLHRLLPQLEWIDMPLGQVVYESGITQSHVYFPVTSIVSLLYVMENGSSAEIAVVGKEGIVGVSLFMGGGSTPSRAVVQSAGKGFASAVELEATLTAYAKTYNHHIPQRALKHLSPVQALQKWQLQKPHLFKHAVHKQAGLDNAGCVMDWVRLVNRRIHLLTNYNVIKLSA